MFCAVEGRLEGRPSVCTQRGQRDQVWFSRIDAEEHTDPFVSGEAVSVSGSMAASLGSSAAELTA